MPLPDRDFDTTEVAVPWRVLCDAGHQVVFATERAGTVPAADPRLLAGVIFVLPPVTLALSQGTQHAVQKFLPEVIGSNSMGAVRPEPFSLSPWVGLAVLVQSTALVAALSPYTLEGAYGRMLDGSSEQLASTGVLHFEMEALMQHKALIAPVLTYRLLVS